MGVSIGSGVGRPRLLVKNGREASFPRRPLGNEPDFTEYGLGVLLRPNPRPSTDGCLQGRHTLDCFSQALFTLSLLANRIQMRFRAQIDMPLGDGGRTVTLFA